MLINCNNQEVGLAIAQSLGLPDPYFDISGDNGTVYFCDNGPVVKITRVLKEAIICQQLIILQNKGLANQYFPEIYNLKKFEQGLTTKDVFHGYKSYVIVREGFDDIFFDDDKNESDLRRALSYISYGWNVNKPEMIKEAYRIYCHDDNILNDIVKGLKWFYELTGIKIGDIRLSNIGVSKSGKFGMRDLGIAYIPDHLINSFNEKDNIDLLNIDYKIGNIKN